MLLPIWHALLTSFPWWSEVIACTDLIQLPRKASMFQYQTCFSCVLVELSGNFVVIVFSCEKNIEIVIIGSIHEMVSISLLKSSEKSWNKQMVSWREIYDFIFSLIAQQKQRFFLQICGSKYRGATENWQMS